MTYMAKPILQEPLPPGHEIYNLGRPILNHHFNILSLSDVCLGVKKKISYGITHFHFMTYMATP